MHDGSTTLPASTPTAPAQGERAGRAPGRPALESPVAQLGRAAQKVHAYPLGSPFAARALDDAHRALTTLDREVLLLRVTPRALLVDDQPLTPLPAITDLAGRLHKASVGTLAIARSTPVRDLGIFCRELVTRDVIDDDGLPLPDVLHERGVEKIEVTLVERPSVIDVALPPTPAVPRRATPPAAAPTSERAGHLYPPGRGWVRFDPGAGAIERVSLADLASLVADPFALAGMLIDLAGEPAPSDPADALESRFEEIAMIFRETEPARAEALLAGLARAVLSLDPDRRRALLRNTVLPGLLEGRLDGAVLRHLPDVELADALALLLDVQVAAPELMAMALERLELPEARAERLRPLVEEHLLTKQADEQAAPGAIDGYADGRIRIDLSRGQEFRDFSAFDLALDDGTERLLVEARQEIVTSDPARQRLQCLLDLLRLEANPDTATTLLGTMRDDLAALRQAGRAADLVEWLGALRRLAEGLADDRPAIAELLRAALRDAADESLIADVVRDATPAGEHLAVRLVEALGPPVVPPLIQLLAHGAARPAQQVIVKAMTAHAPSLVEAVSAHLGHQSAVVVRDLVTVLGHGGPAAERVLASVLDHADEHVVREAFRGLAHLGTRTALRSVAERLGTGGAIGSMAEVAFWRFPTEMAGSEALRLLGDDTFTGAHPRAARTLLARAAAHRTAGLEAPARRLRRLRLHVWSPARMALGWAAARVGGRP